MISFRQALRYYVAFYEAIADHRRACVLGFFDKVIYGYGAVIERINSKFKTHFSLSIIRTRMLSTSLFT